MESINLQDTEGKMGENRETTEILRQLTQNHDLHLHSK